MFGQNDTCWPSFVIVYTTWCTVSPLLSLTMNQNDFEEWFVMVILYLFLFVFCLLLKIRVIAWSYIKNISISSIFRVQPLSDAQVIGVIYSSYVLAYTGKKTNLIQFCFNNWTRGISFLCFYLESYNWILFYNC